MRNKKTLYILLPAVVLIWGLVFYKIFSGINKTPENTFKQPIKKNTNAANEKNDTIQLIANYRDPFLGAPAMKSKKITDVNQLMKNNPFLVGIINWPDIKYGGIINNKNKNKTIVLMSINNRSYLVSKGDTLKEIKVKDIFRDSIQLIYRNMNKTYRK